jgi:hypothetical protein
VLLCYLMNLMYQLSFKCMNMHTAVATWGTTTAFVVAALVHVKGLLQVPCVVALPSCEQR